MIALVKEERSAVGQMDCTSHKRNVFHKEMNPTMTKLQIEGSRSRSF